LKDADLKDLQQQDNRNEDYFLTAQCCQMCYFSAKFGYFLIWLAGKICFLRVADVLAIFEIFWLKIWRIFVQDLDQCLVH